MKGDARILKRLRSDEEKIRRHKYGDKGAKFQSKEWVVGGTIANTITTLVQKDNIAMVEYEY